jgi:glutaredoxin
MLAACESNPESDISDESTAALHYPVLIISLECAFCPPAKNLWSRIADELGIDLQVIIVEKERGVQKRYGISGVPCLVCGPDKKAYGLHYSHEEAKDILSGVLL